MIERLLALEHVNTDRLFCNPANPRLNDDAVPHVAASLRRFGWRQPIVAKPSGEVIAGNTRLKAAQSLKMTSAPVVWFDGDDIEATAYAIADSPAIGTGRSQPPLPEERYLSFQTPRGRTGPGLGAGSQSKETRDDRPGSIPV